MEQQRDQCDRSGESCSSEISASRSGESCNSKSSKGKAAREEAANRVAATAEKEAAQGSCESRNSEGSRGSGASRSEGSDSKASSIASKATATAIPRDKLRLSQPPGKARVGTPKFDMAKGEGTANDVCDDETEDGSDWRRPQQKQGEAMGWAG